MKISFLYVGLMLFFFLGNNTSFAQECYLVVDKTGDYNPKTISDFAIPLVSAYIEKVIPVPRGGISTKKCQYEISLSESGEGITITLSGRNASAFGDAKRSGIGGVRQALLRAVYRAKPNKKREICSLYSTIIPEDCGTTIIKTKKIVDPLAKFENEDVYLIIRRSKKCVDVKFGFDYNGNIIHQYSCKNASAPKWQLRKIGDMYYQIISKKTKKCWIIDRGIKRNSVFLKQWSCLKNEDRKVDRQSFRFQHIEDGYFRIIAKHSQKCIKVLFDAKGSLYPLEQVDCNIEIPKEAWQFKIELAPN